MMHTRPYVWPLLTLVAALVVLPGCAGAQRAGPPARPPRAVFEDSSAAAIFANRRNAPALDGWGTTKILRQENRAQPQAKLDSIADTLAAIVMRDADEIRRLIALSELRVSGVRHPKAGGVPYLGAMDRLIRIHREANNDATRRLALNGLLQVGDRQRGLAYLRQIATAVDGTAWAAIGELTSDAANDGGVDSQALLRELYDKKLVRQPIAEQNLWAYAAGQGWVPSPPVFVRPPPRD